MKPYYNNTSKNEHFMEKLQENMCKQACFYVSVQDKYTKAHVCLYFLHLVLPLHHNGNGSGYPGIGTGYRVPRNIE